MADDKDDVFTLSWIDELEQELASNRATIRSRIGELAQELGQQDNARRGRCSKPITKISDSKVIVQKKRYMERRDDQNTNTKKRKQQGELETDAAVLQRRQKQIDYGKNTIGYDNYRAQVEISKRGKDDPKTPDKYAKYSRRSWDNKIKTWRKRLHQFDNIEGKAPSSNDEKD